MELSDLHSSIKGKRKADLEAKDWTERKARIKQLTKLLAAKPKPKRKRAAAASDAGDDSATAAAGAETGGGAESTERKFAGAQSKAKGSNKRVKPSPPPATHGVTSSPANHSDTKLVESVADHHRHRHRHRHDRKCLWRWRKSPERSGCESECESDFCPTRTHRSFNGRGFTATAAADSGGFTNGWCGNKPAPLQLLHPHVKGSEEWKERVRCFRRGALLL